MKNSNRATVRPEHLAAPEYLSKSPPVPSAAPSDDRPGDEESEPASDPTRYGDWVLKGIAVDF